MSIITDNYLWFIIIGCILLLITVGYYADKTGFGKSKLYNMQKKGDSESNDANMPNIVNSNATVVAPTQPIAEPINNMDNISLPQNNNLINVDNISSDDLPIFDLDNDSDNISKLNPSENNYIVTNNEAPKVTVDNSDMDIWKF